MLNKCSGVNITVTVSVSSPTISMPGIGSQRNSYCTRCRFDTSREFNL